MMKKFRLVLSFCLSFWLLNIHAQKIPTSKQFTTALQQAYSKYQSNQNGTNAHYIKALAQVDSTIFGIAVVTSTGEVYTIGNYDSLVSIQSISKVFTLAHVIESIGASEVDQKIGVNATGEVFNSITAIEKKQGAVINPFVNPGAIATTSLVPGADSASKWNAILAIHEAFAGRNLMVNMPVFESELHDNLRNQAIAHLLLAYNRMYFNPVQTTNLYTRQCAINVHALDLALMSATLANGGVNPKSKEKVVSPSTVKNTLAVMSTAGLYDHAGQWLYYTGIPAKSGVGGGLIAVVPGVCGIAVVSPPLDEAGNSVRGQLAIQFIIDFLQLNPYLVTPKK